MFTGIIEGTAKLLKIEKDQTNIDFWLTCNFVEELKIDQSLAHNGVCLTVVEVNKNQYKVTAIEETLLKTNLGNLQANDYVNIERCMPINGRLDGHIVQGHVDQIGKIKSIQNKNGSYIITITYDEESTQNVTVEKGSVCINGISLTVVDAKIGEFSVAIIPYTWQHTNLQYVNIGDLVNLEFDILGKYIRRLMNQY